MIYLLRHGEIDHQGEKRFVGQIDLDAGNYIVTDRRMHTNQSGVYACGDVQDAIYRQAVTAAGTGCIAAIEAEKYIAEHEGRTYPESRK